MRDLFCALEYLASRYGWMPTTAILIYYLNCNWIEGSLIAFTTYYAAKGNYKVGYAVCWSEYNEDFYEEELSEDS